VPYPFDPSAFEADIFGLPRREPAPGASPQEPVEAVISRFLDELRAGRSPSIDAYARRHAPVADQLRELLPLVAAMEQWKAIQEPSPGPAAVPEEFAIERLGRCRVLREIGRGGMGIVYEAEQEPFRRHVAVKVLPWKLPASSQWRERFEREARTAANLHHPHIVPVFEFGDQDGWCYYVMHLVEGIGIDRIIKLLREPEGSVRAERVRELFLGEPGTPAANGAAPRRRDRGILRRDSWVHLARIGIQVAQALQHSHVRGILHRDIKPGNLLVDCRGSVWVTDFGLALETDEVLRSSAPDVAGTLRYLAPEQLDGFVDRRSDIYSLGVTLYELCTLQPLFEAPDRAALVQRIRNDVPRAPRSLHSSIPADLERIILKAIAKDPARRYPTADEMLRDLMRFTQGQPVEPGATERSRLWPPFRRE
jgi:serine/threonine protein kinase